MKVFYCKRQQSYSGGLILVAANSVNEAFETFCKDKRFDWMIEWADDEGHWAEPFSNLRFARTSYYPREKWELAKSLEFTGDTPQVLLEDGHTE